MLRFLPMLALTLTLTALGVWLVGRPRPSTAETAGISVDLARDRAERVSGLRYAVALQVPSSRAEAVRGSLTATFDLSSVAQDLSFDFTQPSDRLVAVDANGYDLPPRVDNGHIVVPAHRLVRGRNVVRFTFVSGNEALNRQDEFLYSLFVPARASFTFPCFDQPDLKARWTLSLEVPSDWTAVSNARQSGRTAGRDRTSYTFDETAPLPTYLFAFAVGRFEVESAERAGRTFRMFHRETDAAKLARNRDAVFDLHAAALEWLEDYTRVGYPFGKFDFVLVPSFQFGGMEHPGAVFYNANSVLLDESATEQQRLARANLISHETAHMWFGDLVTMRWFDDVWMKEVLANFMAAKIVNPVFPAINHDLRFFLQHYPVAYEVDRTAGANPIRQRLDNLADAGSLYGAIIYQKAPIVMRQLERVVGEPTFRAALQEYLTLHGFANADWTDLVRILDRRTPADVDAWSRAWITEPGRPTVSTVVERTGDVVDRIVLRQSDPRGRNLRWPQALQVAIGRGPEVEIVEVTLDRAEVDLPGVTGRPTPDWILPVAGGWGYGAFRLDAQSLAHLSVRAGEIADPLTRGAAFATVWEAMLDRELPVVAMRELLLSQLPRETVELNLQLMLDLTRSLFWRWTPEVDRPAYAAALEPVLRRGLDQATTTSAKAAWFGALRAVAATPATLTWLGNVWARRQAIPGLPLAEVDESDLAMDLAVRDVPDAASILETQLARITNADRRARFAFIAPALAPDVGARQAFFARLADVRQRSREAWVLDAARYLHHPLRAGSSARLVRPALELLQEIQRTGDIFFPKRWADATLSGYQSTAVATEVRAFIEGLPPEYPPRLRWVLLSAADPLFRAAGIDPPGAAALSALVPVER